MLAHFASNETTKRGVETGVSIHASAQIDEDAEIGQQVCIGAETVIGSGSKIYPQVYIGERVRVGKQVIIHPGVRIYSDSVIGDRCIIQANAVIGSHGFGYTRSADNSFSRIPHLGHVVLENDVEVGANTVIDRAVMGATVVKRGAKLDNLIQVAHNVTIGEDTGIAAQAGIAGSAQIGARCLIGGQAGIVGHVDIADDVQIQAKSGVGSSIDESGSRWWGYPALPYFDYLRSYVVFKELPKLKNKIDRWFKERDKE